MDIDAEIDSLEDEMINKLKEKIRNDEETVERFNNRIK